MGQALCHWASTFPKDYEQINYFWVSKHVVEDDKIMFLINHSLKSG